MSRNISISEESYEALKREKGDRSFSEVIMAHLEETRRLEDVIGQRVLDPDVQAGVREDLRDASRGALDRVDDETL